ncbi:NAD-dependent protein deacylase, partial [Virgibacillus halodenitrificans]|nr:NAD-dependent protein deacylase [Virgibacillus halodenitrificans]
MLKKWLQNSNYTVVFTGAGMSTESGLPDFRSSNQGLWNKKDPSKIASTDALNNNVNDFISFYRERVLGVKEYSPHKGHYILADLEKQGYVKSIITQNVDGFHQQAGSKNVAELHGTLQTVHCQSCGEVYSSQEYVDKEYYC